MTNKPVYGPTLVSLATHTFTSGNYPEYTNL